MGSADVPYRLESSRVEWSGVTSPVRVGILRSVGYSHNTFALESFVDELAHENNIDPLELRRNVLPEDSRLRACLEKVAKLSDWTNSGARPLGVAVCSCFGSHVAIVVETSVDENQVPQVLQVWAAADCGLQIHPDNIKAQIEGGIVFGLSATLYGKITLDQGSVIESNFHDYQLARQSDCPEIHVELIPSAAPPSGVGELAVPVVAPAICNSLYRLTGERRRSLPLVS